MRTLLPRPQLCRNSEWNPQEFGFPVGWSGCLLCEGPQPRPKGCFWGCRAASVTRIWGIISPRAGGAVPAPQGLDGGLHAPFTALPEPQQLQDVSFLIILPHPEFL